VVLPLVKLQQGPTAAVRPVQELLKGKVRPMLLLLRQLRELQEL
jgi:hypothetical protein